jgi:hypothetical protein
VQGPHRTAFGVSGRSGQSVKGLEETDCGRSDLADECRLTPIPDVGQPLGRLSAVPRNLTFGGGGAHRRVSDSATRSGQRLLPVAANWYVRPTAAPRLRRLAAALPPFASKTARRPSIAGASTPCHPRRSHRAPPAGTTTPSGRAARIGRAGTWLKMSFKAAGHAATTNGLTSSNSGGPTPTGQHRLATQTETQVDRARTMSRRPCETASASRTAALSLLGSASCQSLTCQRLTMLCARAPTALASAGALACWCCTARSLARGRSGPSRHASSEPL